MKWKKLNKSIAVLYKNVFYVGLFENVTFVLIKRSEVENIKYSTEATERRSLQSFSSIKKNNNNWKHGLSRLKGNLYRQIQNKTFYKIRSSK